LASAVRGLLRKDHDGLATLAANGLRQDRVADTVLVIGRAGQKRLRFLFWDWTDLVMAFK
jgi:hypothetical protein